MDDKTESVQFFLDSKNRHRWSVIDDINDIHICHTGFSSRHDAIQNLFINHAMMSIFVGSVARGDMEAGANASGISFEKDEEGKFRWNIKSSDELTGMSYDGFGNVFEAMNNLIIIYTLLTVFVASIAQERSSPELTNTKTIIKRR